MRRSPISRLQRAIHPLAVSGFSVSLRALDYARVPLGSACWFGVRHRPGIDCE